MIRLRAAKVEVAQIVEVYKKAYPLPPSIEPVNLGRLTLTSARRLKRSMYFACADGGNKFVLDYSAKSASCAEQPLVARSLSAADMASVCAPTQGSQGANQSTTRHLKTADPTIPETAACITSSHPAPQPLQRARVALRSWSLKLKTPAPTPQIQRKFLLGATAADVDGAPRFSDRMRSVRNKIADSAEGAWDKVSGKVCSGVRLIIKGGAARAAGYALTARE